ncbi:hypothetical protein GIY23_10655 [Allosaccharopolyspora coralli]|uniref:Uncharacterized protein n=1 Tax=Allosaccharopolyspora coralli TaxID=2665642 RepID=A0A5Q3QEN1_9PSEU|nr:hypothetical protein [Allosaccharopolyspora coralli]QGK69919.1 hypothetical protein GIY23_10655 [Allosaccharopolyspora coralli]
MRNDIEHLPWRLITALGAFALLRPLASILGLSDTWGKPATPLLLTGVITAVWVGVVVARRVPRPLLTLSLAGAVYAVLLIPLSAVLSLLLSGQLQGPLATPVAIVPLVITNVLWGAVAGAIALAMQQLSPGTTRTR